MRPSPILWFQSIDGFVAEFRCSAVSHCLSLFLGYRRLTFDGAGSGRVSALEILARLRLKFVRNLPNISSVRGIVMRNPWKSVRRTRTGPPVLGVTGTRIFCSLYRNYLTRAQCSCDKYKSQATTLRLVEKSWRSPSEDPLATRDTAALRSAQPDRH